MKKKMKKLTLTKETMRILESVQGRGASDISCGVTSCSPENPCPDEVLSINLC